MNSDPGPIRVWKPEGWKLGRRGHVSLPWRIAGLLFRILGVVLRPLSEPLYWITDRRFARDVVRELAGAFPGRVVRVARVWHDSSGWPTATVGVGDLIVSVSTHMGEYGGRLERGAERATEGIRAKAVSNETFYSIREVAEAIALQVKQLGNSTGSKR